MTLEQMDKVVQAYCAVIGDTSEEMCADCRIRHLCEPIMGEFDKHPDVLKQAYDIVSNANDECDGCHGCKFANLDSTEYPCDKCKYTVLASKPEYETRPLLYTPELPKTPEVPKIDTEPAVNLSTAVHHPSHYNQGGIECIDAMVSAFGKEAVGNFCLVNAFKYCWRAEHKNGMEDIDKAIFYLNKYKELKADA